MSQPSHPILVGKFDWDRDGWDIETPYCKGRRTERKERKGRKERKKINKRNKKLKGREMRVQQGQRGQWSIPFHGKTDITVP